MFNPVKNLLLIIALLGLISCQETIKELKEQTKEECSNPTHKHYDLLTMGYITPWKKNGYEMIEKYYNKFDIISPTWFELQPEIVNNEFNVKIDGANYVDMKYLKEIKSKNNKIKVLPRFHCSNFNVNDLSSWLGSEENSKKFIKILLRRIKHNKFDGAVFDCIHIWMGEEVYIAFAKFIPLLSQAFKENHLSLVVTLFPYAEQLKNAINKNRFEFLAKYIDYFNIMTYDYIQYHKNSPQEDNTNKIFNAPLTWIKESVEYYVDMTKDNKNELLQKILLGLPFHGFALPKKEKEKGSVIDSEKFSNFVMSSTNEKLIWNEVECEHLIEINEGQKEFIAIYPTRKFLKERLNLSKTLGLAGCAIWDVGNGNENFMDEF